MSPVIRRLATSSLVNMAGAYAMTSTFAIYLRSVLGFSTGEVAIVYGAGPAAGVLLSIPAGRMVDRLDTKLLMRTGNVAFGVITCTIPLVDGVWPVAAALAASGIAMAWNAPARSVYMVEHAGAAGVQRTRAFVRKYIFAGSTVGSTLGALALARADDGLLVLAIVINGASSIVVGAVLLRNLPDAYREDRTDRPRPTRTAILDHGFVVVTVLLALVNLATLAIASALPIWVAERTAIPVSVVPVLGVAEAVGVIALQVRLARWTEGFWRSRVAMVVSAGGLLVSLALIELAARPGMVGGLVLLGIASVLYTLSSIVSMSAQWGVSYSLRPLGAQGEYQGLVTSVQGAVAVIGPAVVLYLCLSVGHGWVWLGAVLVAAAICAVGVATWWRSRLLADGLIDSSAE